MAEDINWRPKAKMKEKLMVSEERVVVIVFDKTASCLPAFLQTAGSVIRIF